jgi:hypothetical protein
MDKPSIPLAVVMQRRALRNRWQSELWEPWGVLAGVPPEGPARLIVDEAGIQQWLHPGFQLTLHRDEAEGYYLNVSSASPKVFVLWRMDSEAEAAGVPPRALPLQLTASYDEAGRWLDGGHFVDGVPMPAEVFAWVGEYVERNYRPEPKKRIKPRSFVHPKDRAAR